MRATSESASKSASKKAGAAAIIPTTTRLSISPETIDDLDAAGSPEQLAGGTDDDRVGAKDVGLRPLGSYCSVLGCSGLAGVCILLLLSAYFSVIAAFHIEPCVVVTAMKAMTEDAMDSTERQKKWDDCVAGESKTKLELSALAGGRRDPPWEYGYHPQAPALSFVLGGLLLICSIFFLWKAIKWSVLWRFTAAKLSRTQQRKKDADEDKLAKKTAEEDAAKPGMVGRVKQLLEWWDLRVGGLDATYASYREVVLESTEVAIQLLFVSRLFASYGYIGPVTIHLLVLLLNASVSIPILTVHSTNVRVTWSAFVDIFCDVLYTVFPFVSFFYYLTTGEYMSKEQANKDRLPTEAFSLYIVDNMITSSTLWSENISALIISVLTTCLPPFMVMSRFDSILEFKLNLWSDKEHNHRSVPVRRLVALGTWALLVVMISTAAGKNEY
jgi:hypothetical protein